MSGAEKTQSERLEESGKQMWEELAEMVDISYLQVIQAADEYCKLREKVVEA